jgi:hypothetical protein
VLASDIDPVSVRVARDNARLNHVGAPTAIIRANGLGDRRFRAGAPFDLVFGNILLGALKRLAPPIGMLAAPGEPVVVSGLFSCEAHPAISAHRWRSPLLNGASCSRMGDAPGAAIAHGALVCRAAPAAPPKTGRNKNHPRPRLLVPSHQRHPRLRRC